MSVNIDGLSGSLNYNSSLTSDYSRSSSSVFADALIKATQKVDSEVMAGTVSSSGTNDILVAILLYLLMSGESSSGSGSLFDMFSSDSSGLIGNGALGGGNFPDMFGSAQNSGLLDIPSDLSALGLSTPVSNPSQYEPIVKAAMSRLGDPYSQARAGSGDYTDCSYLSRWCYRSVGVEIPRTAAEQARYCAENGMTVSREELKPGDLVFYSLHENGRYKDITHVGIYAGNGMMVDASSIEGEVVYREVFRGAIMYGRPR